MQHTQEIGPHTLKFFADDGFCVTLRGVVQPEEVQSIVAVELACAEKHGYVLVVIDAAAVTGLPAETRREASQLLPRLKDIQGLGVIYGTSQTARVLFGMLLSAMRILSQKASMFQTLFVANEAEAFRQVNEARVRFQLRSQPR
jgi:hypothetical protein